MPNPAAKGPASPWIPEPCLSLRCSRMQIWAVPKSQWYCCPSCSFAMNKWAHVSSSHTGAQYLCRLCWLRNGICNYAVTVMSICAQDCLVHLKLDHMPAIAAGLPRICEPGLKFWYKFSISPRQSACQIGLASKQCYMWHNRTQNTCQ